MTGTTKLSCACGQVHIEFQGAPIVSVGCCCNSRRAAGVRMQALPAAPAVLTANGATPFVLFRKDRVRFLEGADRLKEFRLTPDVPTRRVVATCCSTPLFLELQKGHWFSLYGGLWPAGTRPRIQMRTMASDLPAGTALPDDVPNGKRQSVSFFAKLLGVWIAMGFRSPKDLEVSGEIYV